MKITTNTQWTGGMSFEAKIDTYTIQLDASPDVGGEDKGPRPKPLLMVSLAGCTGMDVISILGKMKVIPKTFNVRTEGDLLDEHPKAYSAISIIYEFEGDDLPIDKIRKAINLSIERYCGVNETLKKAIKMNYEIQINGEVFGLV